LPCSPRISFGRLILLSMRNWIVCPEKSHICNCTRGELNHERLLPKIKSVFLTEITKVHKKLTSLDLGTKILQALL